MEKPEDAVSLSVSTNVVRFNRYAPGGIYKVSEQFILSSSFADIVKTPISPAVRRVKRIS